MNNHIASFLPGFAEAVNLKEQARGVSAFGSHQSSKPQVTLSPYIEARRQEFSPELRDVLNYAFDTLWGANPAWRAAFKSKSEVVNYKTQLGRAMEAAGVNTLEKVDDGLNYAVQQPGAFMPSTGDFVTWCKEIADAKRAKLEAYERSKRITDEKLLLCGDTWEVRQQSARQALRDARSHIGRRS